MTMLSRTSVLSLRSALVAVMLVIASAAYASPITFYFQNTTFASGATGTGSVVVDTATGLFGNISFTYTKGADIDVFNVAPYFQSTFQGHNYYADYLNAAGDILVLEVPGASLIGYTGSALCTNTFACGSSGFERPFGGADDLFATGSLSPTPEPSSLMLLGTGAIGIAGVLRKRFARA